jgi:signal transduction histidine kinase
MFDERQIERWRMKDSALPRGSRILFRETSLWSRYRWAILLVAGALLIQMGLILALLLHRRRLRISKAFAKKLTKPLLHSQEEERRRIARDLHDGSAQDLFAIKLGLTRLSSQLRRTTPFGEACEELQQICESALRNIRSTSYLLYPPLLERGGLVPALKWFIEGFNLRSEMKVTLNVPEILPRLDESAERALFRLVQESLSNALRHSGSPVAIVEIHEEKDHLIVQVKDEGHGFDEDAKPGRLRSTGVGLASMHERMQEIGGTLLIQSTKRGTRVQADVPVNHLAAVVTAH